MNNLFPVFASFSGGESPADKKQLAKDIKADCENAMRHVLSRGFDKSLSSYLMCAMCSGRVGSVIDHLITNQQHKQLVEIMESVCDKYNDLSNATDPNQDKVESAVNDLMGGGGLRI